MGPLSRPRPSVRLHFAPNLMNFPVLLLVPTEMEMGFLSKPFLRAVDGKNCKLERCGFGVVAAGIRTQQCIHRWNPKAVILMGIAGSLSTQASIGSAIEIDQVACYGIGAGSGSDHILASEMGWSHWPAVDDSQPIQDVLSLAPPGDQAFVKGLSNRQLLTCCSASACDDDVRHRLAKFPDAIAEDMEGFAVAVACSMSGIPLSIVRGISNRAGQRDIRDWRIAEAMSAAEQLVLSKISV
jgi:futalosine hydrolase